MKILHVFRTPVGGLFRHVRDLARGQAALGHEVGMICDSTTGGSAASELLGNVAPFCSLGIERIEISRLPGLGDFSAVTATRRAAFMGGWARGLSAFRQSTRRMGAVCITAGWLSPGLSSWSPNGSSHASAVD